MKNIIKKIVILLFSTMFSLTVFGMIDFVDDRNVMLLDGYDIEIRESVKKKLEDNSIPLEKIAKLYNSAMKDSSTCYYEDQMFIVCNDQMIYIFISKDDRLIVDFFLSSEKKGKIKRNDLIS